MQLIFHSVVTFVLVICFFFFFNDTATTEIYTLSLHDALPISAAWQLAISAPAPGVDHAQMPQIIDDRSEEHTSELQSLTNLVCRLLLEKKKKRQYIAYTSYIW